MGKSTTVGMTFVPDLFQSSGYPLFTCSLVLPSLLQYILVSMHLYISYYMKAGVQKVRY